MPGRTRQGDGREPWGPRACPARSSRPCITPGPALPRRTAQKRRADAEPWAVTVGGGKVAAGELRPRGARRRLAPRRARPSGREEPEARGGVPPLPPWAPDGSTGEQRLNRGLLQAAHPRGEPWEGGRRGPGRGQEGAAAKPVAAVFPARHKEDVEVHAGGIHAVPSLYAFPTAFPGSQRVLAALRWVTAPAKGDLWRRGERSSRCRRLHVAGCLYGAPRVWTRL